MRTSLRSGLAGTAALLPALWSSPAVAQPAFPGGGYKVIVNSSQSASAIDKPVLADIFLNKTTRWRDDSHITPVDHSSQAPLRVTFTKEILNETMTRMMSY